MFEDSLVISQVSHASSTKRWTMLGSLALQCAVGGLLILLPLLHPERLAVRLQAGPVLAPLLPKPPVHVERAQAISAASSTSVPVSTVVGPISLPSQLPSRNPGADEAPVISSVGMAMPNSIPSALSTDSEGHPSRITVTPGRPAIGPLRVSGGVSAGMLMAPIRPVYPAIAKAAGVQGTVVVEAVISRSGSIESLHVASGPPMLQNAAVEAIRAARYQPYRLNGEPTAVETTITVNFRIGG
ncbi:MAG: TonB family protein [Edaphobacter sp.]|nr:TonB family protein [Edaphobacter sp.]